MPGIKRKLCMGIMAFSIGTFVFVSTSNADATIKTLEAWYGQVKVIYGGKEITSNLKPFIVEGTTYIPLRAASNLFNKDITWDATSDTVTVADRNDPGNESLKQQIQDKDYKIKQLEQQVKQLQSGNSGIDTAKTMDKLEDELKDEYGKYEDIRFDIMLSGDADTIRVRMSVDLDDYDDEWSNLSNSKKQKYIRDICEVIATQYPDGDIDGYIKDKAEGDRILEFTKESGKSVEFDDLDSDSSSLNSLEDDVNSKYADYFEDMPVEIQLDKSGSDITYTVSFSYKKYEDEWDDISDSELKSYMRRIYSMIDDEYSEDDYDIRGVVYDTAGDKELARYRKKSDGQYEVSRYE